MFGDKTDFNSLKIADFGLATYSEDDREERVCGTLIYKSPEQINNLLYDHFVDLWAAGFILYILCSGGKHPRYIQGSNSENYIEEFKKCNEWNFPPGFPL